MRAPSRTRRVIAVAALSAAMAGCLRPWPEAAPVALEREQPPQVWVIAAEAGEAPLRTVSVAAGDTLYAIARREEVAIRSLIEANRLVPPYTLVPGQMLAVPKLPEYVVREGDTVYRISRCTGVDMALLTRINAIPPPYLISPGQRLRVPPPTRTPECPPRAGAPPPSPPPAEAAAAPAAAPEAAPVPAASPFPEPPPRAGARFLWPVEGRVLSAFGPKEGARRNDGINIAAPAGAPVRAAENGVVVYAGNELRGYGNLLLIRHAGGWTSAYAHNGELLVGRGAVVERGQVIARVGQSGSVAEPQSHFELRKGAQAVDPVAYLVRR
jgi:murein DD-endopeptidase MepM/ murein hydrolase activator NlpD